MKIRVPNYLLAVFASLAVVAHAGFASAAQSSPWSPTSKDISDTVSWTPSNPDQFHLFSGQHVVAPTSEKSYLSHLSPELLEHYEVVLYVDKAARGGVAQRVIWLEKPLPGEAWNHWRPRYVWRTSTGRERQETKGFSGTPTGIYNFHGTRQHKDYRSRLFDGAPMPFAMFIDYRNKWGGGSGIAFHAAPGNAHGRLGHRASGGCMRLHYSNARYLFHTLRSNHRGFVPKMALLDNGTTSLVGTMKRDEFGRVVKRKGLKALIVIDDGQYTAVQDQLVLAAFTPQTKPGDLPFHLPDLEIKIEENAVVRPTSAPRSNRSRARQAATIRAKPKKTSKSNLVAQRTGNDR